MLLVVGIPCVLFAVLITASIVKDLFLGRPPKAERAAALTSAELLACHGDVRALLDGLVREAARLQLEPLDHDEATSTTGDAFGADWDRRWRDLESRCRFPELADRGLGTAYDRMAWVHRSLPRTKLQVREWMARFSRDLRPEIAEMRRALDKSQADLKTTAGQGKRHE